MCYPKPGPRCSSHALIQLTKARHKLLKLSEEKVEASDEDKHYIKFEKLYAHVQAAQQEYSITLASIKAQEKYLLEKPDDIFARNQLEQAKALRKARLAAMKNVQERNHRSPQSTSYTFSKQGLSADGEKLFPLKQIHPDILTMMKESEKWSHHLTDEEIDSVRRYSQGDYSHINGSLLSTNYKPQYGEYSKNRTLQDIKNIDSALAKHNVDREVVVYRRHLLCNDDGSMQQKTLAEQQEIFQVGSVYEPGFYQSTSLDPQNAPTDNDSVVFFEIKAKRAVPIAVVASQGTNEKEYLLPRDTKYRVVANTNKVHIMENADKPTILTVIQLEEI